MSTQLTQIKCPCCSAMVTVAFAVSKANGKGSVRPPQSIETNPAIAKLAEREWLEAAYAERSAQSIAVELDCNPKTVLLWLEKHAIPKRPPGAAPRAKYENDRRLRRERMIAALRAWADENDGDSPTQAAWSQTRPEGAPSEGAMRDLFGSWNEALRAAGLKQRKPGEYVSHYHATKAAEKPGRNRQMVTGRGLDDRLPGTVKHVRAA